MTSLRILVRTAVLAVIMIGLSTSAWAQGGLGIKAGLTRASVQDDTDLLHDSRKGLTGGVFVNIPLGAVLSFQPEVLYTQKGSRGTEANTGADFTLKLDYIEVPLLGILRFPAGPIRPFIGGGGYLAFERRARLAVEGADDVDFDAFTEDRDHGFVVTGGVELGRIAFEARYSQGLKNLDPEKIDDLKNRAVSFFIAYTFGG